MFTLKHKSSPLPTTGDFQNNERPPHTHPHPTPTQPHTPTPHAHPHPIPHHHHHHHHHHQQQHNYNNNTMQPIKYKLSLCLRVYAFLYTISYLSIRGTARINGNEICQHYARRWTCTVRWSSATALMIKLEYDRLYLDSSSSSYPLLTELYHCKRPDEISQNHSAQLTTNAYLTEHVMSIISLYNEHGVGYNT